MAKYWLSEVPEKCDGCGVKITRYFVDGKTALGPWAFMCVSCHQFGPGTGKLGVGIGQEYTKQEDGRFMKTGG